MVDQTANFVRGTTDAAISAGDTTISVVDASEFPDPANGEYNLVLWDDGQGRPDQDPDAEIVRVTARDTTNNDLTVTRAQESTSDVSHPDNSALQLGTTAKVVTDLDDQFTNIEVFTTDGTFNASGIDDAVVECVGGGGGGGGLVDNGTDTVQFGSGGGGGGYAKSAVDLSTTGSVSVTVGSGGAEETAGGDSSFGSFASANGGGAGTAADNNNRFSGGSGGSATGDVTVTGATGEDGATDDASFSDPIIATSPSGGDSVYGFGGGGRFTDPSFASNLPGESGSGYGAGGGGAMNVSGAIAVSEPGGSGTQGIVIVRY